MLNISPDILKQFDTTLAKKAVPFALRADYRKWLRCYLDFRSKYPLPDSRSERVRLFVAKLKEKNQTSKQQEQAAQALSLFFTSQRQEKHVSSSSDAAIPSRRLSVIGVHVAPSTGKAGWSLPLSRAVRAKSIPTRSPVGIVPVALNPAHERETQRTVQQPAGASLKGISINPALICGCVET